MLFNEKKEVKLLESILNNNYDYYKFENFLKKANNKNKILNLNKQYKFQNDSNDTKCNLIYIVVLKNNSKMIKSLINYANENNIILNINEKIKYQGDYIFLKSINNNNIEITQLLIDYANEKNIIINILDKNEFGNYPMLEAVNNNNSEMVKLLINYANDQNIIINIHEKNKYGNYPLLKAVDNNNIVIIKLLIEYANDKNIILNDYIEDLFCKAVNDRDNTNIVKLLIDYANDKNIILNINTNVNGKYPFFEAVGNNNIEIIKLLIDYANDKDILLKINDIDVFGNYPLLNAIKNNNIEMINLLIDYANTNNIIFDIGEKMKFWCHNPLFEAVGNNNIEIIKILIDYANDKNIKLKINDVDKNGDYPLLIAIEKNNTDMVNLLINYANLNNVILDINDINKIGNYSPLLKAVGNNNTEIVKILIDYANINNIVLNVNDEDINGYYPLLIAANNNNTEMIELLINYSNVKSRTLRIDNRNEISSYPPILNTGLIIKKIISNVCENPVSIAFNNNNTEMVKLLLNYASDKNIKLEINNKNKFGNCLPLLKAFNFNNIEMVKLLINYADINNIILNINDKDENGNYPLILAIDNNNIEMINLLINYANIHNISLSIIDRNGRHRKISVNSNIGITELLNNFGHNNNSSILNRVRTHNFQNNVNRSNNSYCGINNSLNEQTVNTNELELRERIEQELREKIEKEIREKMERRNEASSSNINYNNNTQIKTPAVVIATRDFPAEEYDQLDISKDELLVVTNWNIKEGWVFGYRKNHPKEKGLFPKVFIKIYNKNNKDDSSMQFKLTPEYKIQFENKIKKLRSQQDMKEIEGNLVMIMNRENLFNNAYEIIMNYSSVDLKKKLKVRYENEEGMDAGGLLRDFFYNLSKEIGNPNYSLFQYSNDNTYELAINPKSETIVPNYLSYFKFIGRILGLAIFHKQYLSVNFNFLFYKRLLGLPLKFSDFKYIDPEFYENINWLKENEGTENLSLTFAIDIQDCFGVHKKIELKPNGATIDVNDNNKYEYIDLVVNYKLNNSNDKKQFEAIKEGFYEIIPMNLKSIIDEFDLKYLISGVNEINVDDWENNTDYEGYSKNDVTIIHFWNFVRDLKPEKQMKLLLFATGNSQVPVTGFKDLQGSGKIQHFRLKKAGSPEDLPISHTCFNRIDLPPYTNYTQLKQKLLLAVSEGMGEFSIE